MTDETAGQDALQEEIETLRARGCEVDTTPRGLAFRKQTPSFSETLNYLMDVGAQAERFEVMPSIRIESGTAVKVRVGPEPTAGLTAAEIAFAKALTGA